MNYKQQNGQFFTTNADYILQGFENFIKNKDILDPFAGNGDLLAWAEKHQAKLTQGLDIDKKLLTNKIKLNDSLLKIPYTPFNLTNPPYLAKNKMNGDQKNKYNLDTYEDLYLLSIQNILNSDPDEGIIIIPINFFSAENSQSLRAAFLDRYFIPRVNYFQEQVFEDTTYNVVSFYYYRKNKKSTSQDINFHFFPENNSQIFSLEEQFNYQIGGNDLFKILNTELLKIKRLTEKDLLKNKGKYLIGALFNDKKTIRQYSINQQLASIIDKNIILLNCIDTNNSINGWIKAENINDLGYSCLVGKNTSRNLAFILLPSNISIKKQIEIIRLFNKTLNDLRIKYKSLFLTNFRDNNRKRISFEFCYKLISYCYNLIT